jgi:hypothetical protein
MMLERSTLRLRVEAGVFYGLADQLTGETPRAWRGADLEIQVGIFRLGAVVDLSNLTTLLVEVYDASRTGLPFLAAEIAAASLDNTLTLTTWQDATKQHGVARFTATQTNVVLGGRERPFWLVVAGVTTSGNKVTYGGGPLILVEDGRDNGLPGPVVVTPASDTWRFRNGAWEAFFQEDLSWRPLLPVMNNGNPTMVFGDPV